MVKLFFVGMGVFTLIVVGAVAAIFGPMWTGVQSNLGGSMPTIFHVPIPGFVYDAVYTVAGNATPQVLLTGILGIVALTLVYTFGSVIAYMAHRWKRRQAQMANLRWQGRVAAAREAKAAQTTPEIEHVWK